MQKSSITLRSTPHDHNASTRIEQSPPKVTLKDIMRQLQASTTLTNDLKSQVQSSSASTNSKLERIQGTWTGVELNIVELRSYVSDLSAAQEALINRISSQEMYPENAEIETAEIRNDNLRLKAQIIGILNRISSTENTLALSGHGRTTDFPECSTEIIISGIPSCVTEAPLVVAAKVFDALDVSELSIDILCTRKMLHKSAVAGPSTQSDRNVAAKQYFIVSLKSACVRDFIIGKKHKKK